MNYIDGFRDPAAAQGLALRIRALGEQLARQGKSVNIMEVCGSHTMAISRGGIRSLLTPNINLISGPGCPVCVTVPGYIDAAIELVDRDVTVATFGDLIHVPGSTSTLTHARASGGRVEVCYSPSDAVALALRDPAQPVAFLGVGFETTIPAVVSIVDEAIRRRIDNLSVLTAFKLVPPAMKALLSDPGLRIDAFLCPAHVSAIIGAAAYEPFAGPRGVPCVIAGFEVLDILLGLEHILEQILAGRATVENLYRRVVTHAGNPRARALMDRLLVATDAPWRGMGVIPGSGLSLRPEFSHHDASVRYAMPVGAGREHPGCGCGDVIKGKLRPTDCPLFGKACTPDQPIGPCMVSSEGTCSAYFKYGGEERGNGVTE